jgi:xanthosine utilization system XapX-like protein
METTIGPPPTEQRIATGAISPPEIPLYIYATVFSSFCVITGLIWDICWHLSIGRDGLLSPPHLVIYLGAVVAGVFSGYEILRKTFLGTPAEKSRSVKIWGFFYSSLGSLFCVWGALAMLTSAPFDDWWHNTYGLDVTILSPPHSVLILGIIGIQFGAMISVIAVKNQSRYWLNSQRVGKKRLNKILFWLFSLSAGFLLTIWYTLLSEELGRMQTHRSSYYIFASCAFPILLTSVARAFKHKWTITAVAAVYTGLMLGTLWIIPLFPAEPKLGPILHHFDHYQGFQFPLLLIFPAIFLDILRNRYAHLKDWKLTLILGTAFLLVFFGVQWYFGAFLMESPHARNWFFGSHYWYFGNNPDWAFRYKYAPWMEEDKFTLLKGLGFALAASLISTRLGLLWGNWMYKIQR